MKRRVRWGSVLAACVTVCGVLSDPHVFALLPSKVALGVAIAGSFLQAVTKPVKRTEVER